jgi:hypothetical protein
MPTTIKLKNSVTTTNAPSSLAQGEVAINVTDKKVWVGNAATTPVQLLGTGSDGSFTNLTVTNNATFDTTTLVVDATNNRVGVGTASPASALDVNGSSILRGTTSILGGGVLDIYNTAGTNYTRSSVDSSGNFYLNNTSIAALQFGTNNTERMRIDSSGNVGIGASSPSERLRVQNSTGVNATFTNNVDADVKINLTSGVSLISPSTGVLALGTSNTERMRIDSSGNIGIGTNNPATVFEVKSSGGSSLAQIYNARNVSGDNCLTLANGSNANNTSSYYLICQEPFVANRMFIFGNGNVANLNNSYGSISDIKVKENIVDATPKLEKLNQVRIVNYNLIGETQKQIGVIAQELEQIFPGMIDVTPDIDMEGNELGTTSKSVKYSVFVPMLIKAIQEQQAIITDLKSRIEALENK